MIQKSLWVRFRTAIQEEISDRERQLWESPPTSEVERWRITGHLQGLQSALDTLQVEADKTRKDDQNL